ncbi:MAG: sugar transporter [Boseongicola sp.]
MFVLLPTIAAAAYLFLRAADQFASTVAFSVRTEEFASPVELFGGIAEFASSGSADADILYEFMNSQEIVRRIDDRLGLVEFYSKPNNDPIFGLKSDQSIEDLHSYWSRMVRVFYDRGTGLIEVRALAFDPEDARSIATAILKECARLVEELSAIAQADTTEFARAELGRAVDRMKVARERMTTFRSRTQIVDPTADLQGQMGLLSILEQQQAAALIEADLLRESTLANDPRLKLANRRIAVIETRIAEERRKLGFGRAGGEGVDYAMLLAEFERLAVDRQFSEEAYTAALAAFDQAQAEARRKSRYLAAHVHPTLAETAQFPRRFVHLAMLGFFLVSGWAIAVLVFYSLRDRR